MRKVRLFAASLLVATLLAGCGVKEKPYVRVNGEQGITETQILIGNTAATSGAFAGVGVPFNAGLKARLHAYNVGGGLAGREVVLNHYDDGFVATEGLTLTKKLVEDDKVFALVGHFGTNTVGATVDYIQETGVPMVYGVTGINDLYLGKSVGNPLMTVQPIYKTEGKVMVARVYAENEQFGEITKLGIVSTSDDAGQSILEGVNEQLKELKVENKDVVKIVIDPLATDYNAQATQLKTEGVNAVILATNQAPFTKFLTAMKGREVEIPVYTSYVSASVSAVPDGFVTDERRIFANAWVDLYSEAGGAGFVQFLGDLFAASAAEAISADEYAISTGLGIAYAIAGYVAGDVFVQGLDRMDLTKPLDWFNYIDGMESSTMDITMAGTIDFTEGKRVGLESLLLLERDEADATGWVLSKLGEPLADIVDRIA